MDWSVVWKYLTVFAVGGALCVPAQLLIDKTKLTPARILVGYVVTGVILGAVGLYQPLADFAGAGANTPFFISTAPPCSSIMLTPPSQLGCIK